MAIREGVGQAQVVAALGVQQVGRQQIASAIDVVIQLERQEDGKRRLVSVQEINGMEGEMITMTEIFTFERRGIGEQGEVLGDYRPSGMVPTFRETLAKRGIELPLSLFRPDWMEALQP